MCRKIGLIFFVILAFFSGNINSSETKHNLSISEILDKNPSTQKTIDAAKFAKSKAFIQQFNRAAPKKDAYSSYLTRKNLLKTIKAFVALQKTIFADSVWLDDTKHDAQAFFTQKHIFPNDAEIEFRGDLHGDMHSLALYLLRLVKNKWLDNNNPFKIIKPNGYMVFLGDYVDRGHYGPEVVFTVLQLALHNPGRVFLVRGNHEAADVNNDDFDRQIISRFHYWGNNHRKKFLRYANFYSYLPAALFVGGNAKENNGHDYILACHGGLDIGYDPNRLLGFSAKRAFHNPGELNWWRIESMLKRAKIMANSFGNDVKSEAKKQLDRLADEMEYHSFMMIDGFQWNDFEFDLLFDANKSWISVGRPFVINKPYSDLWMKHASGDSHRLMAIFRAHQHGYESIPQILDAGGLIRLWPNREIQWDKIFGNATLLEAYSVFTFNVAPRTQFYENLDKSWNFNFDTVGRLVLNKGGFDNWKLYPEQISAVISACPKDSKAKESKCSIL